MGYVLFCWKKISMHNAFSLLLLVFCQYISAHDDPSLSDSDDETAADSWCRKTLKAIPEAMDSSPDNPVSSTKLICTGRYMVDFVGTCLLVSASGYASILVKGACSKSCCSNLMTGQWKLLKLVKVGVLSGKADHDENKCKIQVRLKHCLRMFS